VYLEPDASPTMSISANVNLHSTEGLEGEYDSEHASNVDMGIDNTVNALTGSIQTARWIRKWMVAMKMKQM
jgi:hypothetical protein